MQEEEGEESDEKGIEYDLEVVNLNSIDVKGHCDYDDHTESENSSSSEGERDLSSSDSSSEPHGTIQNQESASQRRLTFIEEESKELDHADSFHKEPYTAGIGKRVSLFSGKPEIEADTNLQESPELRQPRTNI